MACLLAAMVLPSAAAAEPGHVSFDWGRFLVDLDGYVRHGSEKPNAAASPNAAAAEHTSQIYVQNAGNAWFGVAPRVSLVARDWGGSFKIAGDRLSLTDAMRLSASTRMVLSRVRFGDIGVTRITPFLQLGFGQWRTDGMVLPVMHATQTAAQVGGGIEIYLASRWQLALEASATNFIRDGRTSDDVPQTRLWSTTVATRFEF